MANEMIKAQKYTRLTDLPLPLAPCFILFVLPALLRILSALLKGSVVQQRLDFPLIVHFPRSKSLIGTLKISRVEKLKDNKNLIFMETECTIETGAAPP